MNISKDTVWNTLGLGVNSSVQLFVILLSLYFSGQEVTGVYTLAISIVLPLTILANLSLKAVFIRGEATELNEFVALRIIMSLFMVLLSVLLACLIFNDTDSIVIAVLLVSGIKFFEMLGEVCYYVHYKSGEGWVGGLGLFFRGILYLLVFVLSIYVTGELFDSLVITLIALAMYFFLVEFKILRLSYEIDLAKGAVFSRLLPLCNLALPLGLTSFIVSLGNQLPKYFIEFHLGTEKQAIFSTISYIIMLGAIPIAAFGMSIRPKIIELMLSRSQDLFRLLVLAVTCCIVLSFCSLLLAVFVNFLDFLPLMKPYNEIIFIACLSSIPIFVGSISLVFHTTLANYKEGFFVSILYFLVLFTLLFVIQYFESINTYHYFLAWGGSSFMYVISLYRSFYIIKNQ